MPSHLMNWNIVKTRVTINDAFTEEDVDVSLWPLAGSARPKIEVSISKLLETFILLFTINTSTLLVYEDAVSMFRVSSDGCDLGLIPASSWWDSNGRSCRRYSWHQKTIFYILTTNNA